MGKGLHRVFKAVVNELNTALSTLVESVSKVSHFIPEPSNVSEATRSPSDVKNDRLKANLKEIKKLNNNQNFLIDDSEKGDPEKSCMDVYKAITQSNESIDKLKLRILVRGDFQNKEMIGDTWATTASKNTLKYFLAGDYKHKSRVNQLDLIGAFLQANVKHRVFVKLDSRYGEYFPEYANYFGRPLRLKKSMYGMNNSGKIFADDLTN